MSIQYWFLVPNLQIVWMFCWGFINCWTLYLQCFFSQSGEPLLNTYITCESYKDAPLCLLRMLWLVTNGTCYLCSLTLVFLNISQCPQSMALLKHVGILRLRIYLFIYNCSLNCHVYLLSKRIRKFHIQFNSRFKACPCQDYMGENSGAGGSSTQCQFYCWVAKQSQRQTGKDTMGLDKDKDLGGCRGQNNEAFTGSQRYGWC